MHLAAALDKPGVAVYGPTDPARNGPYGKSFTVLRAPGAATTYKRRQEIDPSMLDISPAAVLAALKDRLAGRTRGAGVSS
jgi:heptosyltransferase-1